MSGIRKIKRNIAKKVASENGLKANRKYVSKFENEITEGTKSKSGTKIAYEKLFRKGD